MSVVRPFKAVRPAAQLADQVAALPYDVMNSQEAREMVVGNPHSFLHVDKAEIDLASGNALEIVVNRENKDQIYVEKVIFNDKVIKGYKISMHDVMRGGVLEFYMK